MDRPSLTYADSSALTKLVVAEAESATLSAHLLEVKGGLVSSRVAVVEVSRAARAAISGEEALIDREVDQVLGEWRLASVSDQILSRARGVASPRVRALDAIHLATALEVEADQFISYDRRQLEAAIAHGLVTASPGWPTGAA